MNKSKRLRVYQTSYQALCFEQGHQKTIHHISCVVLCVTLRLLPSVVSILEKRSKHLHDFQAADVASVIQWVDRCQVWEFDSKREAERHSGRPPANVIFYIK